MLTLEKRVQVLEEKVSQLLRDKECSENPWWEKWFGAFKDDPTFDEAVKLGAEYRRSQPNPADNPDAIEL